MLHKRASLGALKMSNSLSAELPVQVFDRIDDHARPDGDEQNILGHPYKPVMRGRWSQVVLDIPRQIIEDHLSRQGLPDGPLFRLAGRQTAVFLLRKTGRTMALMITIYIIFLDVVPVIVRKVTMFSPIIPLSVVIIPVAVLAVIALILIAIFAVILVELALLLLPLLFHFVLLRLPFMGFFVVGGSSISETPGT